MILTPCQDLDFIKEFLLQDDLYERASSGEDKEDFSPKDGVWLLVIREDDVIGVIFCEQDNSVTMRIHPYMIKEYRYLVRYMMKCFYNWFLTTNALKLIVSIPSFYKKMYNSALKTGFTLEGVNRKSYLKDGVLYDQWTLGMTREEITQWAF